MNIAKKYSDTASSSLQMYELESGALIKTASALNRIKENWETERGNLSDALDKNRLLWSVIAGAMREEDCPQPENIKSNILNLALFIFQSTISLLSDPKPESLDILISINLNIAKGLIEGNTKKAE